MKDTLKLVLFITAVALLMAFSPIVIGYYFAPSQMEIIKSDGLVKDIPTGVRFKW